MRDHDLDLIAALVEGRLDDETEARALIASSPEHAAEYESQKLAYESLKDLGPVALSDTERAALHRDVWTSLHVEPAGKTSSNPWWYRWTAVAATLVVVGGSAAVLSQNMGGDEAMQTFAEISEPLDAGEGAGPTTTVAAADEAPTADGDSAGGGDTGGAVSPTTVLPEQEERTIQSTVVAEIFSTTASEIRQADESNPDLRFYDDVETVDPVVTECVEAAAEAEGLEGFEVVATTGLVLPDAFTADSSTTTPTTSLLTTTTSPVPPTHSYAVASPGGVDSLAALAFVSLDTCEVVYLDE